jgi:single-strand DNA-binding protein
MSLNKVQCIGNLCSDPEVRTTDSGTKIANFSVAVNEKYKDKDGNLQENAEFIPVTFFGRQAEVCEQYLNKGSQVYIEGKWKTSTWKDEATGENRYKTGVNGNVMQMLGGKSKSDSGGDNHPAAPEDDCPF